MSNNIYLTWHIDLLVINSDFAAIDNVLMQKKD